MRWKQTWRILAGWLGVLTALGEVLELAPYPVEAWHFSRLGERIPADVVRIDAAGIAESGLHGIPAILEQLAGVRFRGYTGSGNEGELSLRGFGDNSGLRVLVLVDGMAFNPSDMSGINWLGLSGSELETVEVIRGGQGVLYGNHAVSGVIKLQTRRPGQSGESRWLAEAGSHESYRGGLSHGRMLGGMGIRVGLNATESEGFREHSDAESRTAYLAFAEHMEGASSWSGRLQWNRYTLNYPGPLTYAQMLEDPRQSLNSGEPGSETTEWRASLSGEGGLGGGRWQLVSGWLSRDRSWQLERDAGETRSGDDMRRVTMKPRLQVPLSSGTFTTGLDLSLDEVNTLNFADAERTLVRSRGRFQRQTIGVYGFFNRLIGDDWEVSGGIRAEHARTDNDYLRYREDQLLPVIVTNRGEIPNPDYKDPPDPDPRLSLDGILEKNGWAAEISLSRKLGEGLVLWAGWDRVYRYPSIDESASYQGYPLQVPLNADLEPETGDNFEAGVKWSGVNWNLGGTVFHLEMEDEIVYDEEALLNVNMGDTVRKGLELDAAWQTARWGLSGRLALVEARFAGGQAYGDRMPLVPELETGMTAWMKPGQDWRVRANWRYLSNQFQGNDFSNTMRRIPRRHLLGLGISWDGLENLAVSLAVDNLLDETYAVTAYSGGFYPGAGRTFRFSLRGSF